MSQLIMRIEQVVKLIFSVIRLIFSFKEIRCLVKAFAYTGSRIISNATLMTGHRALTFIISTKEIEHLFVCLFAK